MNKVEIIGWPPGGREEDPGFEDIKQIEKEVIEKYESVWILFDEYDDTLGEKYDQEMRSIGWELETATCTPMGVKPCRIYQRKEDLEEGRPWLKCKSYNSGYGKKCCACEYEDRYWSREQVPDCYEKGE